MGTITLALAIGLGLGLILSVWQAVRIYTGANPKIIRNLDGSVYRPIATIVGFSSSGHWSSLLSLSSWSL